MLTQKSQVVNHFISLFLLHGQVVSSGVLWVSSETHEGVPSPVRILIVPQILGRFDKEAFRHK